MLKCAFAATRHTFEQCICFPSARYRIIAFEHGNDRASAHTDQRAEPEAARSAFNTSKERCAQGLIYDHNLGPHDVELHQIQ